MPARVAAAVLSTALSLLFSSCASSAYPQTAQTRAEVFTEVRKMTELGRKLFYDPSLSGSGKLSCASCHSPDYAFTAPNALPVQFGGIDMKQPGMRAVPTLKYLQSLPAFTEHYHESEDEGDESVDAGPTGGLTWDGRVDRSSDQARIPLISAFEMSSTPQRVAAAVRVSPYASEFRAAFGDHVFDDPNSSFTAVVKAIEAFEQTPQAFYPYTSKYDAYLAGKESLSVEEETGLRLFNNPEKGNCTACHISRPAKDGSPPQFTDFGLIAIGVPRNPDLPLNRDPQFHDLGACGPVRMDLKGRDRFCGLFRTPTLRNVALKKSFFHNGVYHSLEDAVRFYALRDSVPERIYPVIAGKAAKFNDLPERYWSNINMDAPFGRKPGQTPALNDAEVDDVVAFLKTLTDR